MHKQFTYIYLRTTCKNHPFLKQVKFTYIYAWVFRDMDVFIQHMHIKMPVCMYKRAYILCTRIILHNANVLNGHLFLMTLVRSCAFISR